MMDIYYAAWERGVKTTYYLHMKPRHTAEQSTVKVNKTEELSQGAKRGFGATAPAAAEATPAESAPAAPATPVKRGFGGLA